jgi:hypothetical protein
MWLGKFLNLASIPGFVKPGEYQSSGVNVSVRVSPLYSVVTVNGLDLYFHRTTGLIDGWGANQTSDCTLGETVQSAHSAWLPELPLDISKKK